MVAVFPQGFAFSLQVAVLLYHRFAPETLVLGMIGGAFFYFLGAQLGRRTT